VLDAVRDYTKFMDADFHGVTKNDSNGSHPLEWPLHRGTINYRWDSSGSTAYVQLVGNVVGWWLGLLAPFATIWLLALRWWSPRPGADVTRRDLMIMLLLQYLLFMAVHIYLGTERVMYLYHYFIGLLLTFSLLPLVLAEASDRWPAVQARQGALLGGMTALLLLSFVFYSPLSFHRPLTHGECELRNVIQHVVNCR
jgi:dolichyl-phosphate-mannose--protein O-mannosyl transferase